MTDIFIKTKPSKKASLKQKFTRIFTKEKPLFEFLKQDSKTLALAFFYLQELVKEKGYTELEEEINFIDLVSGEQLNTPEKNEGEYLNPVKIMPKIERIIEKMNEEDFLKAGAREEETEDLVEALTGFKKYLAYCKKRGEKLKMFWG